MATHFLVNKDGKRLFVKDEAQLNKLLAKGYKKVDPTILDMVEKRIKMCARPIYPYDAGLFAGLLGIGRGVKVLEAGTGSGGSALTFAFFGAKVDTYEHREDFFKIARENLKEIKNVNLHFGDIREARGKRKWDVIFLDLQHPEEVIPEVYEKLKIGGRIGVYTPIMDNVKAVWNALREHFCNINAIQLDMKKIVVKKYARIEDIFGFPGFFIWARRFD